MTIGIKTEKREKVGKLEALRESGILPAVFYGHKSEATPIQMKKSDFVKLWKNAGESTIVTLEMPEGNVDALIHDVDVDPVTNEPRHADFYVFEKGHKVEIAVPVEFEGVSPAVKELGGVLVKVLREINIKAEPQNLPQEIIIDISPLIDFESQILAGDVKLPAGVELVQDPEDPVVLIGKAEEEKPEEDTTAPDFSQIEVEKKGKTEEEGGEAAAE